MEPEVQSYPLAPMSLSIRVLTTVLAPLPVIFLAAGAFWGQVGLIAVGLFVLAIWAVVYGWFRPTRFELLRGELRIVWPLRRRAIALSSVENVEVVSLRELRAEFGFLVRVGAGGLWGGFGMLWSPRGRHIDFYISSLGPMVLIRRRSARPLLITPDRSEHFVEALCASIGQPKPSESRVDARSRAPAGFAR